MNPASFVTFALFTAAIAGVGAALNRSIKAQGEALDERVAQPLELTPTRLAWLKGGAERVVETWWAYLSSLGIVRGQALPADAIDDPWIRRAWSLFPSTTTRAGLIQSWQPLVNEVEHELEEAGWLNPVSGHQSTMKLYVFASVLVSLLGYFIFQWTPLACIPPVLISTGFAMFASYPPRLTPHGQAQLKTGSLQHSHSRLAPDKEGMMWAVALGGSAVLIGTPFAPYMAPAKPLNSDSGSSSGCSSTIASCGSSDGGSGCGGGGGGGGGGCGGGGCGG